MRENTLQSFLGPTGPRKQQKHKPKAAQDAWHRKCVRRERAFFSVAIGHRPICEQTGELYRARQRKRHQDQNKERRGAEPSRACAKLLRWPAVKVRTRQAQATSAAVCLPTAMYSRLAKHDDAAAHGENTENTQRPERRRPYPTYQKGRATSPALNAASTARRSTPRSPPRASSERAHQRPTSPFSLAPRYKTTLCYDAARKAPRHVACIAFVNALAATFVANLRLRRPRAASHSFCSAKTKGCSRAKLRTCCRRPHRRRQRKLRQHQQKDREEPSQACAKQLPWPALKLRTRHT